VINFVGDQAALSGLFGAIAKVQGSIGVATKDRKGQSGTATYTYADLNAIDNAFDTHLEANGLAPVFIPGDFTPDGGIVSASFALVHKDGGALWTHMSIPMIQTKAKDGTLFYAPQPFGSALTYIRRYTYNGVFRLVTEDDDGSKGMNERINAGNDRPAQSPRPAASAPAAPSSEAPAPTSYAAVKAMAAKVKYPSSGILGAYLADANGRGPTGEPCSIDGAEAERWLRDNEGAGPLALLVTAADWFAGSGTDAVLRNKAADFIVVASEAAKGLH
jgi:hypothetical protein